jgi:hypothetical protein
MNWERYGCNVLYSNFLQKLRKTNEDLKKYIEYPDRESYGNHIARIVHTTRQCYAVLIHSPAPRCGTIGNVAFILWRVKQAANKLCWLASMCKYNTQGSYSYNHCCGQRGSTIYH